MQKDFRRPLAAAMLGAAMLFCTLAHAQQPQYAEPQFDQKSERHPEAESLPDVPPQSVQVPAGPAVIQAAPAPYANRPQYLFLSPNYHGRGTVVPAQAYSYGWFGASSPHHAVFHWDYFDSRWIWW